MEAVILEEKPEEGVTIMNGRPFMTDAKGRLVPLANVSAYEPDLLCAW